MSAGMQAWRRRDIALLIGLALGLSACGGGGGNSNVKSGSPSSTPTPSPSPSSSAPVPTPPINAQLALTNTYAAHNQGYTGAGVTIGVVDSGIMPNNPAVAGRVLQEFIDVDPSTNNTSIPDVVGHGTWVSEIAAGTSFSQFAGGIAPGANLVSARIIADNAPDDNGSSPPTPVTGSDAVPLGQVNQQLISAGVRVMNNSWGGISWSSTDTATTAAFDQAYAPFVETNGGMVVFAAGNDSAANPSTIASLPTVASDANLQKGWLVAVALNSNNPTQLDSYSNKCGIAMNYCLAAPGDVIVLDKDTLASTTNPTYYIVEGTSFAAPQVSGAAALVWQAYPYFSNYLVQQTLLGTATPLGGSQPNPTFGYGVLNVGAAVNGPEQFNWGNVEVGFSGSSSWNNTISGAGGLILDGPGTLTLSQPSSYTGGTAVNGGTLNAVSLNSSANIASGATLAITGSSTGSSKPLINGSVTNNQGALVVGSTNLTMTGQYSQSGGRLAVPLGSALAVTGAATLSNSAGLYVYGADSGYQTNSHTEVLTATGGLTGTFSSLTSPSSVVLQASLGYGANDAYLNVVSVNLTQIQGLSYSAATYAAAARVQSAFNTINSTMQSGATAQALPSSFVSGAGSIQQTPNVAAMQQSLNSLSGQMYAASAAMTFEAIDADTQALSDRFDALLDHPQLMASGKFQSWTQNLGYQGSFSRSGYDSLGFQLNGSMIGGDRSLGNGGIVGYAISQSRGLGNLAQTADQGFSRALEGMVYGGVVQGNWYAMGRFGVGSDWQDTRRELILGSQTAGVSSFSNGSYDVVYGESGFRFNVGNWKLTPYSSLEYASIERNGFNELGGDGFGLMSGTQSIQRWQAGLGVRGSREWLMANGGKLSLQARLLWQDALAMHGVVPNASFTALQQFTPVDGIGLSRYGSVAGLSLNWEFSKRSNLSFGLNEYDAQREHATMGTFDYSLRF
ncbi:autotransporter serine protease [Dyella psychrodurans]|uniref:Autotransporter domain-containing protein n=1 Tax=Dyella psychrodurans TaxID=1927960 RepID=A0A370XB19_9GAMM|nr:autotransporter serine protease [Dyella psychrodurans]RDS85623.1 autotransporter domain-containing protein [Dyella psychrodurans]